MRKKSVTNSSDATVAKMEYDGLYRRIVLKEYSSPGTFDQDRHFYYSLKWQVLEERIDCETSADRQFVWGRRYVDELILRDRDAAGGGDLGVSGSGLDERRYSLNDALFNVVATTTSGGTLYARFRYDPYGNSYPMSSNWAAAPSLDWEYRFTGRRLDVDTGLQLNRKRYYHNEIGRWVNRDPMGYEGSKWNLYEYARTNPLIAMDPTGLYWSDWGPYAGICLCPDLSCGVAAGSCRCTGNFSNPIVRMVFAVAWIAASESCAVASCQVGCVAGNAAQVRSMTSCLVNLLRNINRNIACQCT